MPRARFIHSRKGPSNNWRGRKLQGGTKPTTTTGFEQSRAPVMDQDGPKNYWSTTLAFYPDAARLVLCGVIWQRRHCSKISRNSRFDFGINSNTLSQRKTWVFPIHSRKGQPTSSISSSSLSTLTRPLPWRASTHRQALPSS